jgi:transposase
MKVQRQSVGIDISKDSFAACLCSSSTSNNLHFSDIKTFKNDKTGFNKLIRWARKIGDKSQPIHFLMEATGVYYERLALHLYDIKQRVHVVLPNTSKHYFSSLNIKTKTDEIDAKFLAQFGVERKHKEWIKPKEIFLTLRDLTRYHVQLQEQKTVLGNIQHSKENGHEVAKLILKSNQRLIKEIEKQIEAVRKEIETVIDQDSTLSSKAKLLMSIKGVGIQTIAVIIAETLGFQYVRNVKQLVSYAGYDVIQRESGTSIKGRTRISKKGNRFIRKALYFPAMVSCRFNDELKEKYLSIVDRKPSKMIGQVAIQRKLLVLMYTLWNKNETYQTNYNRKKVASQVNHEATLDSTNELVLP